MARQVNLIGTVQSGEAYSFSLVLNKLTEFGPDFQIFVLLNKVVDSMMSLEIK
jgi:hypothetical protein